MMLAADRRAILAHGCSSFRGSRTVMLIFLAIALLVLLPWPWNLASFLLLIPLWLLELAAWSRTVKHRRRVVGAQTLIHRDAVVITACAPAGQVRVNGEIWEARCDAGVK